MAICVQISVGDDGMFSVGPCEPNVESLQPVEGGLKEALQQVVEMIKGSESGMDDEGPADQAQESGASAAFQGGFNAVRGGGLGG
jgi:hypothetical protein